MSVPGLTPKSEPNGPYRPWHSGDNNPDNWVPNLDATRINHRYAGRAQRLPLGWREGRHADGDGVPMPEVLSTSCNECHVCDRLGAAVNRDALVAELRRDEGERFVVYDDANGKPIVPGYTVIGHPTIGVGRALDVCPLTPRESLDLLNSSIDAKLNDLDKALPWAISLDDVRYRVLVNMTFNMGIAGLLKFQNTLALIQTGKYPEAAAAMLDSKWAVQVGARATRLAEMMRTGVANV